MADPELFGVSHKNSNRDFRIKPGWGKNKFNSSFPAALCCYLYSKNTKAVYLNVGKNGYIAGEIPIEEVFGAAPDSDSVGFVFESQYSPFSTYLIGTLPGTDLVIHVDAQCKRPLEVKLTALPDNTTCDKSDVEYGSELVVRPDTIVYLACSLIGAIKDSDLGFLSDVKIADWTEVADVIPHVDKILTGLTKVVEIAGKKQTPFLLQPVWKTNGKSPILTDNCLDVFVWSDAGFAHFIKEIAASKSKKSISRLTRTAVWLYKMLQEYAVSGKVNHDEIIDNLTYMKKNDKAFSLSGNKTHDFMTCARLTAPIIKKTEIKNIILGGGQNLLSPERRFDAILVNSPEVFK